MMATLRPVAASSSKFGTITGVVWTVMASSPHTQPCGLGRPAM
jgi:hypothetical protein